MSQRPTDAGLGEIWSGIRAAQDLASKSLANQAVHEAKCDGRYTVIENKLGAILWLLGGTLTACSSAALAYIVKMLTHG